MWCDLRDRCDGYEEVRDDQAAIWHEITIPS
jgi:hypothetical protein